MGEETSRVLQLDSALERQLKLNLQVATTLRESKYPRLESNLPLSYGPAAVGLTLDHHASDAYSRRLEADKEEIGEGT